MTIGAEVFVTGDTSAADAKSRAKLTLKKGEPFTIPPGQFALILTEECVEVPAGALGFISMKTTYKLKGLVNVSGFHVDPGWNGYLTFGVYNAGPSHVHLHRGQDMFLIWFASLDRPNESEHLYQGEKNEQPVLPSKWLTGMSGDVFSPMRIKDDMRALEKEIGRLESWLQLFRYITIPLVVAFLIAVAPVLYNAVVTQWTPILRNLGVGTPPATGAVAAPPNAALSAGAAAPATASPAPTAIAPQALPTDAPLPGNPAQAVRPTANEPPAANQ